VRPTGHSRVRHNEVRGGAGGWWGRLVIITPTPPPPTDPTARALVLARDLLAVLPSVPDLPRPERRLTAVSNLVLDLDVLVMLAVPLTADEREQVEAMIADDPRERKRRRRLRRAARAMGGERQTA
jgi:hypothetical protein